MALLLVMSVISVTAVLGFAILSSASLQAQTQRNAAFSASTDALVDSGIDLACYYLINPQKAPALTNGFWPGGNISIIPGTPPINVQVTRVGANLFQIRASASGGGGLGSRTSSASLVLNPGFKVDHAAAFNSSSLIIPATVTVNGDTQGAGMVTNAGVLKGKLFSTAFVNQNILQAGWSLLTASNKTAVPDHSRLRSYDNYTWRDRTFSAQSLGGTIVSGTVLQPSASNPGGIFRRAGNLIIQSNVTIKGTLIVEGELAVDGANSTITAQEGYPALVVKNDLSLRSGIQRDLTVNGLAWVGGSIRSNDLVLLGNLHFNGALLLGGSGQVDASFPGRVIVTYDPLSVASTDLDVQVPPASVKFTGFERQ